MSVAMVDELTPAQERFAEWLATPRGQRRPERFEDLAIQLNVSQPTLYRWRKRADIRARAQEIVDEAVGGPERVRQVLDKIVEQALQGAAKQQELFLRYAGMLVDRRVTVRENVNVDVEDMTDEELAAAWEAEQGDWDDEARKIFEDNDLEDLDSRPEDGDA